MSEQPTPPNHAAAFEAEVWQWVRQRFDQIRERSELVAKDLTAVRNLVEIAREPKALGAGSGSPRSPKSGASNGELAGKQAETSPQVAEMLAAMRADRGDGKT
jgi:hypothetical protein